MEKTNKITLDNMKDYKFYSFGEQGSERPLIEREIKNVTGIDLSNGFDLVLTDFLTESYFIPLLDPFHNESSMEYYSWKLTKYIEEEIINKMENGRRNVYFVHDSTGMFIDQIDCMDLTKEELDSFLPCTIHSSPENVHSIVMDSEHLPSIHII